MKIENDKLIVIREYKGLYSSENLLKKIYISNLNLIEIVNFH